MHDFALVKKRNPLTNFPSDSPDVLLRHIRVVLYCPFDIVVEDVSVLCMLHQDAKDPTALLVYLEKRMVELNYIIGFFNGTREASLQEACLFHHLLSLVLGDLRAHKYLFEGQFVRKSKPCPFIFTYKAH